MPGPGTHGGDVREIDRHRFPPEILRDGAVEAEVDALSPLPIATLYTRSAKHGGRRNGHRARCWQPRRGVVTHPATVSRRVQQRRQAVDEREVIRTGGHRGALRSDRQRKGIIALHPCFDPARGSVPGRVELPAPVARGPVVLVAVVQA